VCARGVGLYWSTRRRCGVEAGSEAVPHTVFNVEEVADYLHIKKSDVDQLVRAAEIPFQKTGNRVVFRRSEVDAWASQRILGLPKRALTEYHKNSTARARTVSDTDHVIPQFLQPQYIEPRLEAKTKAAIVRDMVDLAERTDLVNNAAELLASVREREQLGPTALAGGMAVLHPGHHDPYLFEESFVVLGRAVRPVPFGSPDGGTTDVFFLVCCQNDKLHLHVLTRICMMCHHTSVLQQIRQARRPHAIYDCLLEAEKEVVRATKQA
jgi:excisionase family DNA binding protein